MDKLKTLSFIFIFTNYTFGNISIIGFLSIRVVLFLIISILLLSRVNKKVTNTFNYVYIPLFAILIFFSFSGLLDYNTNKADYFLNTIVSKYIIPFIVFISLRYITIDKKFLISFSKVLFLLFFFNNIVVLFQSFNSYWAFQISEIMGNKEFFETMRRAEKLNTYPGFSTVVMSGYFACASLPISHFFIVRSNSIFKKIFYLLSMVLGIYSSYILQERSGFTLIILYLFFIFVYEIKQQSLQLRFFYIFLSFPIIFYVLDYIYLIDFGRLVEFSDEIRIQTIQKSLIFIESNFLFGGINTFLKSSILPHNVFFDAFIRGGIFSFLIIVFLLSHIFKASILLLTNKNYSDLIWVLLMFILNSFVHNLGLTNFDLITLFLTIIILNVSKKSNSNINQRIS